MTGGALPLVGRDDELAVLTTALETPERLVWIVGPAGVGKTRVAREAAERFARTTGARLFSVALDECTSADALEDLVARATGTGALPRKGRGADAPTALSEIGPAVLVLDPLDRIEAAPLLSRWLDASPELSILAVARRRPLEPGAPVVEVGVPSSEAATDIFLRAAARARPGFALATDADREAVEKLVRELDRLPLALELAASRLSVMSPTALTHRLENRWELLRRQGSGRHRALDEAIRWSLDLLPDDVRHVLARATVFRGGFSLDAAEAVLGPERTEGAIPIVDALERLRAESLLFSTDVEGLPGEVRLAMHESVRLLAERTLEASERAGLLERHAITFAAAAERWARDVELRGSSTARAHLETERANLVVVVERLLGEPDVSARAADRAMRVLCAIGPVLLRDGAAAELETHLETALAVAKGSGADPRLMARALGLRGPLRIAHGRSAEGERDLAEALVLAHHTGEEALEARLGLSASELALRSGRIEPVRLGVERALATAHTLGDRALRARARATAGALALVTEPFESARPALEEALGLAKVDGDDALAALVHRRLARLELAVGDLGAADGQLTAARALAIALRDPRGEAIAALGLGVLRGALGDLDGAATALEAASMVARRAARPTLSSAALVLGGIAAAATGGRGEARARLGEVFRATELDALLAAAGLLALARLEAATGRRPESDALVTKSRDVAAADPTGVVARTLGALLDDPLAPASAGEGALPAFVRRVPASATKASSRPVAPTRSVEVEDAGRGFTVAGQERVDLQKRRPLRLLLDTLATAHAAGTALGWEALLAAGWPGEKMRPDAGAHRVRVAISTLRKMGLGTILETDDEGYRIARDVRVTRP